MLFILAFHIACFSTYNFVKLILSYSGQVQGLMSICTY